MIAMDRIENTASCPGLILWVLFKISVPISKPMPIKMPITEAITPATDIGWWYKTSKIIIYIFLSCTINEIQQSL